MKAAKPTLQASTQELCGVWLDTVELKGKAKRKQLNRPISKLLNPLAKNGGYSLAVALNFTQTKIQMPNTKQTSISTFFAPQHRVINKMSTPKVPNTGLVDCSSSSSTGCASTSPTPMAFGARRKLDIDLEVSDLYNTEEHQVMSPHIDFGRKDAGHAWTSECMTEIENPGWQEDYGESHATHLNMDNECEVEEIEEDIKEPARKRRLTETFSLPVESDPLGDQCSKDQRCPYSSPQKIQKLSDSIEAIQNDFTQDSDSQFYRTHQEHPRGGQGSHSGTSFYENLHSEEGFGIWLGVHGRTSTQKSFKHTFASKMDEEKENHRLSSSKSTNDRLFLDALQPLSNHKWREPNILSPQNHTPKRVWKKAEEESLTSQHNLTCSLKKAALQRPWREVEEDSLAMLFTQDSEGFKVMAHRLSARSPLKNQTNLGTGREERTVGCKSFVEEEDILFTQDSQGNMVIKH